jgi:CRISPR system Cascade subunit CasA
MPTAGLNMLADAVFPVVCRSGSRRWVSFAGLLDESGDPAVSFDWPRGDLNVASFELAIGLLALVFRPALPDDWLAIWEGRSSEDVAARIAELSPAFNLFGDEAGQGPRFCQDLEPIAGDANAAEALFIDTPGVNGQKKNSDLMTHRGRFEALGARTAAMALYALQQFAPSGGAGNRTGMRGGGPMTTLVLLRGSDDADAPLARTLIANLPLICADDWLEDDELARALPWLGPTLTSDGKPPRTVAEADPAVHRMQAFFGMARRIRLVAGDSGRCPISGEVETLVTGFVQRPWGTSYAEWRHPLTPYRQNKDDAPYSVKPKPGHFGYRDWVGVTVGREEVTNRAFPAETLKAAGSRASALRDYRQRLLAAGWAMNNMEAERFLETVQPLYLTSDPARADELARVAQRNADAADAAARLMRSALNDALFDGQAKSTDTGVFAEATDSFYERTEDRFHAGLAAIALGNSALPDAGEAARLWLHTIRSAVLRLFDEHVTDLLAERLDAGFAQRAAGAHGRLVAGLSVKGKIAREMGVPQPQADKSARPGGQKIREEADQ